jgi:hypothetical protein
LVNYIFKVSEDFCATFSATSLDTTSQLSFKGGVVSMDLPFEEVVESPCVLVKTALQFSQSNIICSIDAQ